MKNGCSQQFCTIRMEKKRPTSPWGTHLLALSQAFSFQHCAKVILFANRRPKLDP